MQSFAWLKALANRLLAACKCTLPLTCVSYSETHYKLIFVHVWHHNKSLMKLVM